MTSDGGGISEKALPWVAKCQITRISSGSATASAGTFSRAGGDQRFHFPGIRRHSGAGGDFQQPGNFQALGLGQGLGQLFGLLQRLNAGLLDQGI